MLITVKIQIYFLLMEKPLNYDSKMVNTNLTDVLVKFKFKRQKQIDF